MFLRMSAIIAGVCFTFSQSASCDPQPAAGAAQPKPTEVSQPAKTLKPQETCPVMGNPINKKYSVDVNGKRIYMCCPGCTNKIKKNPGKYIQILEKKGEGVESIAAIDSMETTPPQSE